MTKEYYLKHRERILAKQKSRWRDPAYRKTRSGYVRAYKNQLKDDLIHQAGGCCSKCGYKKCKAALEFHHVGKKRFRVAQAPNRREAFNEIKKCILVCANCHREIHAGKLK